MRVVVFSGTTEGRMFSKQLAALGAEVGFKNIIKDIKDLMNNK